ncbi:MAG TPA: glycosyltransferase [Rubricoccaceae bacterium]|jgi:glycosyltransferase involved in cell wall biosynthesis
MIPRVSVGLPVYNGERFLQRTLDDLLGGTFADFELVAVDNASTDATPDILSDAARQDSRVRVSRNATNIGALPNANRAAALARAPLFALAAYDDRHAPTFLECLVGALDRAPEAVLAYGGTTLVGENDQPFAFDAAARYYVDPDGEVYRYDAALERPLPAGSGASDALARYRAVLRSNDVNAAIHGVFRRAALDRIGPHRLHGSDRLIVAHAALLGPFAYVPEALFGYRIHAASTVHLTRAEWLAREAGRPSAGSALDGLRTLAVYLRATGQADLGSAARARALAASLGYAVRPDVLRRLVLPGVDNYLGWTHWPGRPVHNPVRVTAKAADAGPWIWMAGGDCVNTI